jgi:uncharacterized membrane protein YfcA
MLGEFLFVTGITAVAGVLQSLTGFGFGMVAVPLLAFILPPQTASVILAFSSFALNVYLIIRLRGHISFSGIAPVAVSVAAGVPIGIFFLSSVDQTVFVRVLGIFLAGYVVWSIAWRRKALMPLHRFRWGIPLGITSGAFSGAFAMGGPPLVVYVSSQSYRHLQHVVTIQVLLGISGAARIAAIAVAGIAGREELILGLFALCGVLIGSSIVMAIKPRVSQKAMRAVVLILISVLSVRYLVFP